LLAALLVIVCVCVEPITSGIACQPTGFGPAHYQPVSWRAPASATIAAPQPSINPIQSAATASGTTVPATSCSYIVGRTPLGTMAPLSFLDKLLAAASITLVGAMLVRRIRFDTLPVPPQILYPPPTPPPIAASGS
jgi:hypothetical protein